MAQSNRDRIGKLLDQLREGLLPFVQREMESEYKGAWIRQAAYSLKGDFDERDPHFDSAALLALILGQWEPVFGKTLDKSHRSYVHELRDVRNNYAHEKAFLTEDTERALDTGKRLLEAISAPQAGQVEIMYRELRRQQMEEEQKRAQKDNAAATLAGVESKTLTPWREVITPHQDVMSGNFQEAEFAADLWQVHTRTGSDEYLEPREFFARTYLTSGLRTLLTDALKRLAGKPGGNPVINLKTNFGGGKTHSMLALYHLFSGVNVATLPGVDGLVSEAGAAPPERVRRVVLVGQKISPGQASDKADGVRVRTFWGELAWQLGGAEGYAMVREADETGTSPGEALTTLLQQYAPCVILIDEWVAYVRQLHETPGLIGGTSDAHFTFAQTLTEAVKAVPRALLVVSLPASDIEVGGERGRDALHRLSNIVARVDSPWRPASQEESYEIVRRRLFQSIPEENQGARESVVARFGKYYRENEKEFPSGTKEKAYEDRLRASYPIHPELFDRLYSDWSALEKFQRTRGVLRLMAKVIHLLWKRDDRAPLIMPAHVPMDEPDVQQELTRYLEDNWVPIVGQDVDGERSLPLELDKENPNFGRFSASRRVARVVFLGSAPTSTGRTPGISARQIKLGCAQPGDGVSHYTDALRRLGDRATYLYVEKDENGERYWYSTQPSVSRTAQERALQYDSADVWAELLRRLRNERPQAPLAGLHVAPQNSGDVPDDERLRLVVLGPTAAHSAKGKETEAQKQARGFLDFKGNGPRMHKNMLVFLAPDNAQMGALESAIRNYLAWQSIQRESETLNLSAQQKRQAETRSREYDGTVNQRIPEAYIWLLVPWQANAREGTTFTWKEHKLQGQNAPAERAMKRLIQAEDVVERLAGNVLRMEMDDCTLWGSGDHVSVETLWKYYTSYFFLPRLAGIGVLKEAVQDGCTRADWASEGFACADRYDEEQKRYANLYRADNPPPSISNSTLVVKASAAIAQIESEKKPVPPPPPDPIIDPVGVITPPVEGGGGGSVTPPVGGGSGGSVTPKPPPKVTRYYGTVELDTQRIGTAAGKIAEELIVHLKNLPGAKVTVTLEIQAEVSEGVPENVVRTVNENSRTLKLTSHSFEAK